MVELHHGPLHHEVAPLLEALPEAVLELNLLHAGAQLLEAALRHVEQLLVVADHVRACAHISHLLDQCRRDLQHLEPCQVSFLVPPPLTNELSPTPAIGSHIRNMLSSPL
eukprot:1914378-Pyramimonas_sp.AAC.1